MGRTRVLIDAYEIADLAGVSVATVRVWAHKGYITRVESKTRKGSRGQPRGLYAKREVTTFLRRRMKRQAA